MPTAFPRTIQALHADRSRHLLAGIGVIICLILWLIWFFFAAISVYEVSESARLETIQTPHAVEASFAGRIAFIHLSLGKDVQKGEVLAELTTEIERLRVEEEQTKLGVVSQQLEHLQQNVASSRYEILKLQGEIAVITATIKRLEQEIELHRIRASTTGRISEIRNLQVGSVLAAGDRIATIIPSSGLRAIGYFSPTALGRIQPGQPASLRFDGYSWLQYGTIMGRVVNTASEPRYGQIQVEIKIHPDVTSLIPLQHGLAGSVEIEVERVTPALLLLRMAGKPLHTVSQIIQ